MKGYGEHWQLSIFFCVLRAIDRVRLERDLKEVIHQREDQVMLVDLGPDESAARESVAVLGQPLPYAAPTLLVV
jgi:CRISPR-associated protein Cas2